MKREDNYDKEQLVCRNGIDEIKSNKVTGAKRCGINLAFFRDSRGELHCVQDLCAHRGASLSKGSVNNGHIQCPFHGIEYDGDGKCVFVPSEGISSEASYSRFNLKHYPVHERNNIVYIWYGDSEPETLPDVFDEIEGMDYHEIEDHWNVDYSRIIENQLDVSHLPFVHHNTIGRGGRTLVNGPKVVWLDENTLQTSADNEVDKGQKKKPFDKARIKSTNLKFKFPNQWLNTVSPDKLYIFAYFIPIDDENALIRLRFYNRFTKLSVLNRLIAVFGSMANKIVESQDKRVVETQFLRRAV